MILFLYIFVFCSGLNKVSGTEDEIIELNHDLDSKSAVWPTPGYQAFELTPLYEGNTKGGYWYTSYKFCAAEHTGTHLDAPSHFSKSGWTVDKIPVRRLFGPVVVIDIRPKVKKNSQYALTAADVVQWVDKNGLMPNNSLVFVQTGWSSRYGDKISYFGHPSDPQKFVFPGLSVGAVQTLLGYRKSSGVHITAVGIDTASIDHGRSKTFEVHQELSAENIYILENLKNLDKLETTGYEVVVMPLKIKGGSGSPARVLAKQSGNWCSRGGLSSMSSGTFAVTLASTIVVLAAKLR